MENNRDRTNAERFLNAYAMVESRMYELIRETGYVPFSQMLARSAKVSHIIASRQNDLRQYHELRNAIVHSRGKEEEIIAEPCDSVTADMEKIASALLKKTDILSVSSHPVKTVREYQTISEAYEMMREMHTSKIPVYEKDRYAGLITLEEIAEWAIRSRENDTPVSEIMTSRKNERVLFVRRNADSETVIRAFENALKHGTTLLAVLITAHGIRDEKPLGIITVADLARLYSTDL